MNRLGYEVKSSVVLPGNNNKSSSADKVTWRCEAARINRIYLLH